MRSDEYLDSLIDVVPAVIFVFDLLEQRNLFVSGRCAEALGFTPREVIEAGPEFFSRQLHPDDRGMMAQHFEDLAATDQGTVRRIEYRLRDKCGAWRWFLSHDTVLRQGGPPPVLQIVGAAQDITARKEAEESLQRSEAQFRRLADAMPHLVWTAYPNGVTGYCNRRTSEYLGLEQGENGHWYWTSIIHPDDYERTMAAWTSANRTATLYEVEHRLLRKDGSYAWHVSRGVPVLNLDGEVCQWFGTATDIDVLKCAENVLRAADKRKDEFIAILAHELRNPLAPMRTAIEVLEQVERDSPQAISLRRMMSRQLGHMARMIEDLLDASRVTRGKVRLRKEDCCFRELVEDVVGDYRQTIEEDGLKLVSDLGDDPLAIEGDRVRLAQVVGNLLHNAHKFTGPGGVITVSLARDEIEDDAAVLTIADTGIGIEPELLDRIFEAFSQADLGLDRAKGGLGLGLSIVKGFVTLHQGTVSAASPGLGHGSTFTLRLPLSRGGAARLARVEKPDGARRLRIVVIEDNRDAADSLEMLLALSGHEVRVAYTGPAGLEVARAWRPDVVLCDLGLPGMDGYTVARALRSSAETQNTFLVAQSGYSQEEDHRQTQDAGFDLHLSKPLDPDLLYEALRNLVCPHRYLVG